MKVKKVVAVVLVGMFLLAGCGKRDVTVDDYGSGNNGSAKEGSSGEAKSLTEMLGGKVVDSDQSFTIGTKSARLDVRYTVRETDELYSYNVKRIQKDDIREDDIVQNLFGDTGKKVSDTRDKMNMEQGDSYLLVYANMYAVYQNDPDVDMSELECDSWVDKDNYYLHNYEGTYNGIDYELLIGYSNEYREMYLSFYPKDLCDISGDADKNYFEVTNPDGMYYNYINSAPKNYNIPEVMADRPNKCTLSDDDLMTKVNEMLSKKIFVSYPETSISFYANMSGGVVDESQELTKCECLFFNMDNPVLDDTFSGGLRDGYGCSLMYKFCNQNILAKGEMADGLYFYNDKKQTMFVNNDGVFAFDMVVNYSFGEIANENLQLLSFDEAMNAFVKEAQDAIPAESTKAMTGDLTFRNIDLYYYAVPTGEGADECEFVPVWVVQADSDRGPIARIIINAVDGSLVEAYY